MSLYSTIKENRPPTVNDDELIGVRSGTNWLDFTLATHVYNAYTCNIFKNIAGDIKLGYYDATNTFVIVNVASDSIDNSVQA